MIHDDRCGDGLIVELQYVALLGRQHHGDGAFHKVVVLTVLVGIVGRCVDRLPHLRRAGVGIRRLLGVSLGLCIPLIVLNSIGHRGFLAEHTGNVEHYILAAGDLQTGVAVGGIVGIFLKAFLGRIQGNGIGQSEGIGGLATLCAGVSLCGVQRPGEGTLVRIGGGSAALGVLDLTEVNELTHGIDDLGAGTGVALGNRGGNVSERRIELPTVLRVISVGHAIRSRCGDLVFQVLAHGNGVALVLLAGAVAAVVVVIAKRPPAFISFVMVASGLAAVDTLVGAVEDILTHAVADGVELAQFLDLTSHGSSLIPFRLRAVSTTVVKNILAVIGISTGAAGSRLIRAVGLTNYPISRFAIGEQHSILGRSASHIRHTQAVAGQHQTGLQVGAAFIAVAASSGQCADFIFHHLYATVSGHIYPIADLIGVPAKAHNRDVNLAATIVGHQRFHKALGSCLQIVHLAIHGCRRIQHHHHRRVVGRDGLLGLHLQGNIKAVFAGLRNVLADRVALIGHRPNLPLDLRCRTVLADGKISVLKDLVRLIRQHAGRQQAQDHDQRQQYGQYTFVLLCHDSFSFSSQDFENEILGGRAGMAAYAALAPRLCVPPFQTVCRFSDFVARLPAPVVFGHTLHSAPCQDSPGERALSINSTNSSTLRKLSSLPPSSQVTEPCQLAFCRNRTLSAKVARFPC